MTKRFFVPNPPTICKRFFLAYLRFQSRVMGLLWTGGLTSERQKGPVDEFYLMSSRPFLSVFPFLPMCSSVPASSNFTTPCEINAHSCDFSAESLIPIEGCIISLYFINGESKS